MYNALSLGQTCLPMHATRGLRKEPFSYSNGNRIQTDSDVKSVPIDGGKCKFGNYNEKWENLRLME